MEAIGINNKIRSILSLFVLLSPLSLFASGFMSATYPGNDEPRIWLTTAFGNLAAYHTETDTWETFSSGDVSGGVSAFNENQDKEHVFFIKNKKVSMLTINRGTPGSVKTLPSGLAKSFEYGHLKATRVGSKFLVAAVSREGHFCKWQGDQYGNFSRPSCSAPNTYSLNSTVESYTNLTTTGGFWGFVPHFVVRAKDNKNITIHSLVQDKWQKRSFNNGNRVIRSMTLGSSLDGSTWLATQSNQRIWITKLNWQSNKQHFKLLPPLPDGFAGLSMSIRASKHYFPARDPSLNQITCTVYLSVNSGESVWTWSKSKTVYSRGSTCSAIHSGTENTYWSEMKYPVAGSYFYPGITAGRPMSFFGPPPLYGTVSSGFFSRGLSRNIIGEFEYLGTFW